MKELKINLERIMRDINKLKTFNETKGNGNTRYSFSPEDFAAREYLTKEMKNIGMEVYTDNAGNLRGIYKGVGINPKTMISGSHIDTVPFGGSYDGVLGVVSAIEVARVFYENNIKFENNYEVIVFFDEEGAGFSSGLLGSSSLIGNISVEKTKKIKNRHGETYYEVLKNGGVNPDKIEEVKLDFHSIIGILELHIEQGIVLEREKKNIGIVKGIFGIRWIDIELFGEINHAGATPMQYRKDAIVEMSKIIASLNELVSKYGDETTVITAGKVDVTPNRPNIIPRSVRTIIDLRGMNTDRLEEIIVKIREKLEELKKIGFSYTCEIVNNTKVVKSYKPFTDMMEDIAMEEKEEYLEMYSGAGHDAAILGEKINAAMIFVPSEDGRSHCKEEYTRDFHVEKGADMLMKALYRILK